MAEIKIPLKQSPTIDLDDLASEFCIAYRDGDKQVILSKDELLTRLKSYGTGPLRIKEHRIRRKDHNKSIGMAQSFNAIWRLLVEDGDKAKAEAAIEKAIGKYPEDRLREVYEARMDSKSGLKGFTKVKRFLEKKGF